MYGPVILGEPLGALIWLPRLWPTLFRLSKALRELGSLGVYPSKAAELLLLHYEEWESIFLSLLSLSLSLSLSSFILSSVRRVYMLVNALFVGRRSSCHSCRAAREGGLLSTFERIR